MMLGAVPEPVVDGIEERARVAVPAPGKVTREIAKPCDARREERHRSRRI
jgi:hypothetical protein